jgi:hypothetical protein
MVGNGVTNWDYDTNTAYLEMAYYHSMYDTKLYDEMKANDCDFTGPYMLNASPYCLDLFTQFNDYVADVNIYDIFGICWGTDINP